MHAARLALLGLALVTLAVALWLTGCGGKTQAPAAIETTPTAAGQGANAAGGVVAASATAAIAPAPSKRADPIVVVSTTAGDIKLQLFPAKSPQTVDNFLHTYAGRGHYEQTIVHHAEPGSMIIAGGYTADLEPKATRTPIYNESRNGLSNRRGSVAMIRDPDLPHSATSQFFINLGDNPALDAQTTDEEDAFGFCVFGEVIEGLEVVERIAAAPTTSQGEFPSVPSPAIVITSVEQIR
jgi:peptidyl-prolyl cis-trans isomerase A (cyclophilin A)